MKKKLSKILAGLLIAACVFTQGAPEAFAASENSGTYFSSEEILSLETIDEEQTSYEDDDMEDDAVTFENDDTEDSSVTLENDNTPETDVTLENNSPAESEAASGTDCVSDDIPSADSGSSISEDVAVEEEMMLNSDGEDNDADAEADEAQILYNEEADEIPADADGFQVQSFIPAADSLTYTDGSQIIAEENDIVGASGSLTLVTRQKYKLANYFSGIAPVGFKITSPDGAKASITKKGLLTTKKAGTIIVTPVIKSGKEKVLLTSRAVTVYVVDPNFNKNLLQAYYLGQRLDMWKPCTNAVSIYNSGNQNNIYCKMKINSKVSMSLGKFVCKKTGTVTITYEFINDQNYKAVYSQKLKVKVAKLNVKKATIKTGKSKVVSLSNIPEGTPINWSLVNVTGSGSAASIEKLAPNKVRITGVKTGVVTLSASVGGKTYSAAITIK